jgi:hypothetical protein
VPLLPNVPLQPRGDANVPCVLISVGGVLLGEMGGGGAAGVEDQQFDPRGAKGVQRNRPAGHDLRHEYACRLAERGAPVTKIQYLLGHASVVTIERYIHHTLAELSKAAAVLESGGVFDPSSDPKVGKPIPRTADSASAEAPDRRIH